MPSYSFIELVSAGSTFSNAQKKLLIISTFDSLYTRRVESSAHSSSSNSSDSGEVGLNVFEVFKFDMQCNGSDASTRSSSSSVESEFEERRQRYLLLLSEDSAMRSVSENTLFMTRFESEIISFLDDDGTLNYYGVPVIGSSIPTSIAVSEFRPQRNFLLKNFPMDPYVNHMPSDFRCCKKRLLKFHPNRWFSVYDALRPLETVLCEWAGRLIVMTQTGLTITVAVHVNNHVNSSPGLHSLAVVHGNHCGESHCATQ